MAKNCHNSTLEIRKETGNVWHPAWYVVRYIDFGTWGELFLVPLNVFITVTIRSQKIEHRYPRQPVQLPSRPQSMVGIWPVLLGIDFGSPPGSLMIRKRMHITKFHVT
jgi:hypothetical protein